MNRQEYEELLRKLAANKNDEFLRAARELLEEIKDLMNKCDCGDDHEYCFCYVKSEKECSCISSCLCYTR